MDNLTKDGGMKVTLIPEEQFPSGPHGLLRIYQRYVPHAFLIHIPGVATNEAAQGYIAQIRTIQPKPLIVLEGDPATQETIDMYELIRALNISMIHKFNSGELLKLIASKI